MSISARFIFYLIIIGLLGNVVYLVFSQLYMLSAKEALNARVGGWYYQVAFVSNVILSLVSIYAFFKYKSKFPNGVSISYVGLILLIAIMSARDYEQFFITPTLFYSPKGVGTWINFGLLFFMAEEKYAVRFFAFFRFLCYSFIVFNLLRIASLGTISDRDEVLVLIKDTSVFVIWIYPFFFFDNTDKTKFAKIAKYALIAIIAFFAFAISSRSYLLMAIIYILIKLKRDLKDGENSFLIVAVLGVFFLGGYYLIANIQNFDSIKGLLSIFTGRIDDDSRTSQLKEFADQFDWGKLFTGVGITGTWNWSGESGGQYQWLDNQFFLVTWWFGIQTVILYLYYLLLGLFKDNNIGNITITNAKIILFFWILACGGFAIYVTISSSLYYYFITLLFGFLTLKRKYVSINKS